MGGAKNHGIVMPDADLDRAVGDLVGAAFGSAGERCMALPVVVPVGEGTAERLIEALMPAIEALKVGTSHDPDAITARWSPRSTRRGSRLDRHLRGEGGKIVDGRGFTPAGP
jgi:malonate-semialdehyde dehydrogenase (acetylating)/methylmalonate-semialdehyde dehydrogenase